MGWNGASTCCNDLAVISGVTHLARGLCSDGDFQTDRRVRFASRGESIVAVRAYTPTVVQGVYYTGIPPSYVVIEDLRIRPYLT